MEDVAISSDHLVTLDNSATAPFCGRSIAAMLHRALHEPNLWRRSSQIRTTLSRIREHWRICVSLQPSRVKIVGMASERKFKIPG